MHAWHGNVSRCACTLTQAPPESPRARTETVDLGPGRAGDGVGSSAESAALHVRVIEFYPAEKKLVYVIETETALPSFRRAKNKVNRKYDGTIVGVVSGSFGSAWMPHLPPSRLPVACRAAPVQPGTLALGGTLIEWSFVGVYFFY